MNGMPAVRKQASLKDFTKPVSTEASDILLHAQSDAYAYQPGVYLMLVSSKHMKAWNFKRLPGSLAKRS